MKLVRDVLCGLDDATSSGAFSIDLVKRLLPSLVQKSWSLETNSYALGLGVDRSSSLLLLVEQLGEECVEHEHEEGDERHPVVPMHSLSFPSSSRYGTGRHLQHTSLRIC